MTKKKTFDLQHLPRSTQRKEYVLPLVRLVIIAFETVFCGWSGDQRTNLIMLSLQANAFNVRLSHSKYRRNFGASDGIMTHLWLRKKNEEKLVYDGNNLIFREELMS